MKKLMVLIAAFMMIFSSMAYAGGDQNCGSNGSGSTGDHGGGAVTQNRAAAD